MRIVCTTPPSAEIYQALPVWVSLNGVDWVNTDHTYSYYIQAVIKDIHPKIGSTDSGKKIEIIGENFSNITEPEMAKCKWTLIDNVHGEKRPMIEQTTPALYKNPTTMECLSPGIFIGGDRASVSLTFNNLDYSEFSEDLIF